MPELVRRLTWGEALYLEMRKRGATLNPLVKKINDVLPTATRPTFAELYDKTGPAEMNEREQRRAWLLLTALGCNPGEWDIPDAVMPRGMDVERLRGLLLPERAREVVAVPPVVRAQRSARTASVATLSGRRARDKRQGAGRPTDQWLPSERERVAA